MQDEWIIDVLTDLKRFTERNALPQLGAALDNTLEVARHELACRGSSSSGNGSEDVHARVRDQFRD